MCDTMANVTMEMMGKDMVMLAVLRQRNFALLWFGQLISLTGDYVLIVALPFYTYQRAGSTRAVSRFPGGRVRGSLGPPLDDDRFRSAAGRCASLFTPCPLPRSRLDHLRRGIYRATYFPVLHSCKGSDHPQPCRGAAPDGCQLVEFDKRRHYPPGRSAAGRRAAGPAGLEQHGLHRLGLLPGLSCDDPADLYASSFAASRRSPGGRPEGRGGAERGSGYARDPGGRLARMAGRAAAGHT